MTMSWEWIAAFTQGDGCIWMPAENSSRAKHPSQLHVTWYQTESDKEVLVEIAKFLAEFCVEPKWYLNKARTGSNAVWHLTVRGASDVEVVLEAIEPFLIGRKKIQARSGISRIRSLPRVRQYVRAVA